MSGGKEKVFATDLRGCARMELRVSTSSIFLVLFKSF